MGFWGIWGWGFGVLGDLGLGVWVWGFRVWGFGVLGLMIQSLGFSYSFQGFLSSGFVIPEVDIGFIPDLGHRVWDLGFRVKAFGVRACMGLIIWGDLYSIAGIRYPLYPEPHARVYTSQA